MYLKPCKRYTVFSTVGVSSVQNFKYMYSGYLCCVCGLISLSSWLLLWLLICGLVHVLFLSPVDNFEFFNSHFPVTILRLHLRTALFWVIMQKVVVISY
jgi:hypothetical protein